MTEKNIEKTEVKYPKKSFYDNAFFDHTTDEILFYKGKKCIGNLNLKEKIENKDFEFVGEDIDDVFQNIQENINNYIIDGIKVKPHKTPTLKGVI